MVRKLFKGQKKKILAELQEICPKNKQSNCPLSKLAVFAAVNTLRYKKITNETSNFKNSSLNF